MKDALNLAREVLIDLRDNVVTNRLDLVARISGVVREIDQALGAEEPVAVVPDAKQPTFWGKKKK